MIHKEDRGEGRKKLKWKKKKKQFFCTVLLKCKKRRPLGRESKILWLLHNGRNIIVEYRSGNGGSCWRRFAEKSNIKLFWFRIYGCFHDRDDSQGHWFGNHSPSWFVPTRVLEHYGRGCRHMRGCVYGLRFTWWRRLISRTKSLDNQVVEGVASAQTIENY